MGISIAILMLILLIVLILRPSSSPTDAPYTSVCWSNREIKEDTPYIVIPSKSCNEETETELDLRRFQSLAYLEIGDESFHHAENIRMEGLNKLEKIVIGKNCFTQKNGTLSLSQLSSLKELAINEGSMGGFKQLDVGGCSALESVEIGNNVLFSSKEFTAVNLQKLEYVTIGDNCFNGRNGTFEVRNCPSLTQIKTGLRSFPLFTECVIEEVPSLETIEMGDLNNENECFAFYSASIQLKSRCKERV